MGEPTPAPPWMPDAPLAVPEAGEAVPEAAAAVPAGDRCGGVRLRVDPGVRTLRPLGGGVRAAGLDEPDP